MDAPAWANVISAVALIVTSVLAYKTWKRSFEASMRQQRAYLGFSFRWLGSSDNHEDLIKGEQRTGVYISNHGQTPAHKVTFRGVCKILSAVPSEREVEAVLENLKSEPPRTCNPGGLPLYFLLESPDPVREPLESEHVYAIGSIQYEDVFHDKHSTKFCVYWSDSFKEKTNGGWLYASVFNTAD